MENVNDEKFPHGTYIRLKSDPTQVYRVTGLAKDVVAACKKDSASISLNRSDIELADDDDSFNYEGGCESLFQD